MSDPNTVSTTFQEPGTLVDEDMCLLVEHLDPGDPASGWAPMYCFAIVVRGEKAGTIELRLSASDFIVQFAGQVGYDIEAEFRGHRLSARALQLLLPLAKRHGFTCLWATVDPEDCDMYRQGDRQRCRYRLPC
jgi:predicted acetyltransferase